MKKYITLIDIIGYLGLLVCFVSFNNTLISGETRYYIVRIIAFLFIVFVVIPLNTSKKLPAHSKYNTLGFIELHIDYEHKGNKIVFYKLCARTIKTAIAKKKHVCFCTWLVDKETLRSLFNNAATFGKPGIFDYLLGSLVRAYYKRVKKVRDNGNPIIKVVIKTDMLNQNQVSKIYRIAV